MKLRAIQSTYVNGIYREGDDIDVNDQVVGRGPVFDVADDYVVNRDVLEVVVPPASGKIRYAKVPQAHEPQAAPVEEVEVDPKRGGRRTTPATA